MQLDRLGTAEPLWLKEPEIPARSRLYRLEPIGLGTALSESMTSYIGRLSAAHSISTGTLISKEITPHLKTKYGSTGSSRGSRLYYCSGVLNGLGVMATDWAEAIVKLTHHNELKHLTLLNWAKVLPTQGLIRPTKAWCPDCYEELYKMGQTPYEPLLWAIEVITTCLHHQRRLLFRCPHCHKKPFWLGRLSQIGCCSRCDQKLNVFTKDNNQEFPLLEDEMRWQKWIAGNISELIIATPQQPQPKRIAEALSLYIDKMTAGNASEFARQLQMPGRMIRDWCADRARPQLNSLLKICFRLKVSLLSLLTKDLIPHGFNTQATLKQSAYVTKVIDKPLGMLELQRKLSAVLESNEYPPPQMKDISDRLKVDYRRLYRCASQLCRKIAARHAEYRKACKAKTIMDISKEVIRISLKLHAEGREPTAGQVAVYLTKPAYFREPEVYAALTKVRQKLGYKSSSNYQNKSSSSSKELNRGVSFKVMSKSNKLTCAD